MLEKVGIDIALFEERECYKGSYALIKERYDENNKLLDDYEVETFIICDDYNSNENE